MRAWSSLGSLALALGASALLMLPARPPVYEVRERELYRDGTRILEYGDGWPEIYWQLGLPARFEGGEEYGAYHGVYDYPGPGLKVFVDDIGFSGAQLTSDSPVL